MVKTPISLTSMPLKARWTSNKGYYISLDGCEHTKHGFWQKIIITGRYKLLSMTLWADEGSKTSYKQNKYVDNYKQIYLSSLTGKNKTKQNKTNLPFAQWYIIHLVFATKFCIPFVSFFFFSFILGADVPREIGRQCFCNFLGKCIVGDEQMVNFY